MNQVDLGGYNSHKSILRPKVVPRPDMADVASHVIRVAPYNDSCRAQKLLPPDIIYIVAASNT